MKSVKHGEQKIMVESTNDTSTITTACQTVTENKMDILEC